MPKENTHIYIDSDVMRAARVVVKLRGDASLSYFIQECIREALVTTYLSLDHDLEGEFQNAIAAIIPGDRMVDTDSQEMRNDPA